MESFDTILIEGVFYSDADGRLFAKPPSGSAVSVEDTLAVVLGREVQLAMHHLPEYPLVPDKWGGGCCLWQSIGKCPAGHHDNPSYLMSMTGRGILRCEGAAWFLTTFEGTGVVLPLEQLEGHHARIAAVTILDLEKMKDALSGFDIDKVETIGVQAKQLQDMLCQLQAMTSKKG